MTNPINYKFAALLSDNYKQVHAEQYPKGVTKIVSYFTPRMTRIDQDFLICYGVQGFIKEYLIDNFQMNFFGWPKEDVLADYKYLLDSAQGEGTYGLEKIAALHDLGYLPLEIKALDEGVKCPVKVPMVEISNTHPGFAWVVNWIESVMSCSLWQPMLSANVAYKYRLIANNFYKQTVDEGISPALSMGDFGFRGAESCESGIKTSAAWLTSFGKTATVPAIRYVEQFYNGNNKENNFAKCGISTEHSVMCSNFAVDGDEITFIKRLLTEIYPKGSVSMVSDSYDYWNLVDNILPQVKDIILNREGTLLVRPDSGDPVEITIETVEKLYKIFGGTKNSKGYIVLPPQIRVIYGDSITPQRANAIFSGLMFKGFAANNAYMGVGSFSFQCLETAIPASPVHNHLNVEALSPYTRDTFGMAVKATYCEIDGKPYHIFKNPKTDTGNFKKSQKGMCVVLEKDIAADKNGTKTLICVDEQDSESVKNFPTTNELKSVFKDGKMVKEVSIYDIRNTLWKGEF